MNDRDEAHRERGRVLQRYLGYQGVIVPTADVSDVARSEEAAGRAKAIMTLPAFLPISSE